MGAATPRVRDNNPMWTINVHDWRYEQRAYQGYIASKDNGRFYLMGENVIQLLGGDSGETVPLSNPVPGQDYRVWRLLPIQQEATG